MNMQWKTHAIGRHLVDVPVNAKLKETWTYDRDKYSVASFASPLAYKKAMDVRERDLRDKQHQMGEGMLVERINISSGSSIFLYYANNLKKNLVVLETYHVIGNGKRYIKSLSGAFGIDRKHLGINFLKELMWAYIGENQEINGQQGFVMGDVLLVRNRLNIENWSLNIELAGKPDVNLHLTGFTQAEPEPGLRQRAGGVLGALARSVGGLKTLRNRKRNVGPIEADEILTAGTQDGKRGYAFKWEAPGKGKSLTEPNLNIELSVGESQYEDNSASFASDEEALALWDRLVSSIRLRPGAV